ncbi:MAG: hypothetical protein CVV53_09275 [Spirochaetae bacterium HGW-Spirochaetae-9]|nr:MAG: hypothetical protein CVV53_09275 [Spirochaetae bacterium HGW-Spirochaetae-9]
MDNSCADPGTKEAEKSESRKLVKSIFIALLAGLLINVFMGLLIDFGELKTAFRATSLVAIFVPFAIVFIIYLIDTLRFKLVFPKFGIRISLRDGLYNNIIGYFFCNITPGSVGGQPFQVLHLSRLGLESTVVSNVVFSRLIEGNIVQLFIVAIFFHKGIGMMSSLGKGAFLLIAGMLITITMTVVLILTFSNPHLLGTLALRMEKSGLGKLIARITKNPCWAEKISVWSQGLGEGFKVLWSQNMGTMLLDILILMVEQLLWAASLYIPLAILTGTASPFPEFLLSYILCGLVSLFIPTPGAAGSIEASYLLVLSALTGKPAATMSAILIWRFGVYYLHLLVGALVYFLKPMKRAVYKPGKDGILSHIRKRRRAGVKPGRPEAGP